MKSALASSSRMPSPALARTLAGGPFLADGYRQAGIYTGGFSKGIRPATYRWCNPPRFEFVINLKTAKVLSLEFPPAVLAIADELIK
jgi:putative tryptophan/tyrosine transport system substrate-binding protein